jgi:CDP-glucose 4,6-dehydratase
MKSFWKGCPVLVTGHEGFLGSNLTRRLLELGASVTGIDIKTPRVHSLFTSADRRRFKSVRGSVVRPRLMRRLIVDGHPRVVFHLAAEALVGRCLCDPRRAFTTNIEGTWTVLEAARASKTLQALVVASSDKAYGTSQRLPYKEDLPLQGEHPYDVSKSCADLIACAYAKSFGLPVCVTRCGNIYGPGEFNFSRIVPDAIRCCAAGRTLRLRSDGRSARDFVFVDDIVGGYLVLAERLARHGLKEVSYNFGNDAPATVMNVLDDIEAVSGKVIQRKVLNTATHEIHRQYLCSIRVRKETKWRPKFDRRAGLRKTWEWYMNYFRDRGRP